MSLRAALLLLLLPVAGVLVIAFLLWRGLNLGFAVPMLESRLSALIGRAVSVGAPPQLRVGERVYLHLGDVEVANASWASDTPLLRVTSADAVIELASVLRGPLIVHQLRVDGLSLALERSVEGLSNLPDFSSTGDEEPEDELAVPTLPVILRTAQLRDVSVTRHDQASAQRITWRGDLIEQSSEIATGLLISAAGTLQDKPWSLNAQTTALQSIAWDAPFSGEIRAEIAGMSLQGNAELPALASTEDLNLTLDAQGMLPPAIAALSPLLTADTPLAITLHARDIDPGIALDTQVRFPNLRASATGEIHQPLSGDGLLLDIEVDVPDVRVLTAALGLGETAELPVALRGRIRRDGSEVHANDFSLTIGEHLITADFDIPDFPKSDGASVNVNGTGPDFAFYQRLFDRPISFPEPYSFSGVLQSGADGAELVASRFSVGKHLLEIEGPIGDFPSYRGSDLRFTIEGPDIDDFGDAFGVSLPNHGYQATGQLRIDQDGKLNIPTLQAAIASLELDVTGNLNGYPEFDDINLGLILRSTSLAATSRELGMEKHLGDVPAELHAKISGSPESLAASDIRLSTAGLELISEAGALRYESGQFGSDVELALTLAEPNQLLGDYADPSIPEGPIYALVAPTISPQFIDLALRRLDGPAVVGKGQLRLPRDLVLDERAFFSADLHIDKPANLMPAMDGYSPPREAIELEVRTQLAGENLEILGKLSAAESQMNFVATIPVSGAGARELTLSGSGKDLRALGEHSRFPPGPLPFSVNAQASLEADIYTLVADNIELAGTRLIGSGTYDSEARSLRANLQIPEAKLGAWLGQGQGQEQEQENAADAEAPAAATDSEKPKRLIPDYPIPLDWTKRYVADVSLETGDLGIQDPLAPIESLIQGLSLEFSSGDGLAQLTMKDVSGSRGSGTGQLTLKHDTTAATVNADIALRDFPGGLRLAKGVTDDLPRFSIDSQLTASGNSTRELAASLTGPILINGSAGVLNDISLSAATESFIEQLFSTLMPMVDKDTDLTIQCAVVAGRAQDGIVKLDPGFVLRSKKVDLSARGEIDLKTEKIRIRFNNQARKGLGISAAGLVNPYVQITGTLARPTLGLDVASGAIAGSAAAATGGLSVIASAFYGRFLKQGNPCKEALERWEEPQKKK